VERKKVTKTSRNKIYTPIRRVNFKNVPDFGFIDTIKGNLAKLLIRAVFTSDDPEFYLRIDQIANQFLHPNGINPDYLSHFMIVVHPDKTGELYYGLLPIVVEIRAKKDIKKGQPVYASDIADIRKMKFDGIPLVNNDRVICLFKVGWKFVLFFDLGRESNPLDIEKMELTLGLKHKELAFHQFFELLESDAIFKKMLRDGWFPFIDLIPNNFNQLKDAYQKGDKRKRINRILNSYDADVLKPMMKRWWSLDAMKKKKAIIESGVNAYITGGKSNYILCIKTLISEIEGIVRFSLLGNSGLRKNASVQEQIKFVIEKEIEFTGSNNSLLIPERFLEYLNEEVFKHFDVATNPDLSRHSVTHGAADSKKYTRARALQVILTIDQLYFMIRSALAQRDAQEVQK
jgi:hypothetical protein